MNEYPQPQPAVQPYTPNADVTYSAPEQPQPTDKPKANAKMIIIISLLLVAVGAAYYFLIYRKKKNATLPDTSSLTTTSTATVAEPYSTTTASTGSKYVNESFPLRPFMKGEKVKALQRKLGIIADGYWGSGTTAALIKAQYPTEIGETEYNNIVAGKIRRLLSTGYQWLARITGGSNGVNGLNTDYSW